MEKNIRCSVCQANAYHVHRKSETTYILKCLRKDGCEREFSITEDSLSELN